jgi:hypothetical protein
MTPPSRRLAPGSVVVLAGPEVEYVVGALDTHGADALLHLRTVDGQDWHNDPAPPAAPPAYRMVRCPLFDGGQTVAFGIAEPADEHEGMAELLLSRASWESQGSPEELHVAMTQPPREPAT